MALRKLTERRKAILQFCHEYAVANGWAASLSEITEACHIGARAATLRNINALADMGYMEYKGSRQLKVLWLP
jgi:SOS-response transcriptional repressor LexA